MHLKECEHNPKKPVPCALGCGLTVPKDEMVRVQVEALKNLSDNDASRWNTIVCESCALW